MEQLVHENAHMGGCKGNIHKKRKLLYLLELNTLSNKTPHLPMALYVNALSNITRSSL